MLFNLKLNDEHLYLLVCAWKTSSDNLIVCSDILFLIGYALDPSADSSVTAKSFVASLLLLFLGIDDVPYAHVCVLVGLSEMLTKLRK